MIYRDFYQELRGRIGEWAAREGKDSKALKDILLAPDFFHLLCKLMFDPHVPTIEKVKVGSAITYFVSSTDVIPEGLMGPAGYIDDVNVSEVIDCTQGLIRIFRERYLCEAEVKIVVIDADLNADPELQETIDINVWSDTETVPEVLTLTESRLDSWRFTAAISISQTDGLGVLQVSDGDTIYAEYIDADDGHGGYDVAVTDSAVADCSGPV